MVEQDAIFNLVDVGFLGADAVVARAYELTHLLKKFRHDEVALLSSW